MGARHLVYELNIHFEGDLASRLKITHQIDESDIAKHVPYEMLNLLQKWTLAPLTQYLANVINMAKCIYASVYTC